jgi:hypothetical protein
MIRRALGDFTTMTVIRREVSGFYRLKSGISSFISLAVDQNEDGSNPKVLSILDLS